MASYFSCFAKKSNQKKATPEVPVAARLPCDARRNGPPRNSLTQPGGCVHSDIRDGQPPSRLRFSAGPTGAPKRSRPHTSIVGSTRKKTKHWRCFGWVPVGPAEKRRALRGRRRALSEHPQSPDCGCELRSRLRVRASQGSRAQHDRDRRGRLLLVTLLGEARKVTRQRRNTQASTKKFSPNPCVPPGHPMLHPLTQTVPKNELATIPVWRKIPSVLLPQTSPRSACIYGR